MTANSDETQLFLPLTNTKNQARERRAANQGQATFTITGQTQTGKKLRVKRSKNDPEGNGKTKIYWQEKTESATWTGISRRRQLRVTDTLQGSKIRARVQYFDRAGFAETSTTKPRTIPSINNGRATFGIAGLPEVGASLSLERINQDPDGDGQPVVTWESSPDGRAWTNVAQAPTLTISQNLENQSIRAKVIYTDGQGFRETAYSNAIKVKPIDNGDAIYMIQGDPKVGQTLSIRRGSNDPDGDGTPSITWFASENGVLWYRISESDTFTVPAELEGFRIVATASYTDGEGFNEVIPTDDLTIPFVNNGSATFNIQGSAEIGRLLSVVQTSNDPDGNGFVELSWRKSLDGIQWEEISTSNPLLVSQELAGYLINAVLQYTDDQGFKQTVSTETVAISGIPELTPDGSDDYGDHAGTSEPLNINSSKQGNLEQTGDRDWFSVDLRARSRYQFNLKGVSLEDPILLLRNNKSQIIDYNDDISQYNLNSQLTFTPQSSERYFLEVGAYDDAARGTYTLQIEELTPPAPGFNNVDGYGEVNAQRAFEQLLGKDLPSVNDLGGNHWGIDQLNAPDVWNASDAFPGSTGGGATIAVIDSGVDLDHPEFSGRIVPGYDFVDGDYFADDGNGHGTHVAGTIAGANDNIGVTGVAHQAKIMPLRVLNNEGYGWTSDIISAVRLAADNNADVINLSLGGGGYSQALADAIRYASNRGSVVVMAAGNSGGSMPEHPAVLAIETGIAVGAVDQNRSLADFSNRAGGAQLDYVTAPGVNILSAVPGGGYDTFSGTSMAAPHVAGIAGLLKSYDRTLSPERIEDLLTGSASNALDKETSSNAITPPTVDPTINPAWNGTLIASIDGHAQQRRSTLQHLKQTIHTGEGPFVGLTDLEVVASSRNRLAILSIATDNSEQRQSLMHDLMASDQFNYLEVDQQFSLI